MRWLSLMLLLAGCSSVAAGSQRGEGHPACADGAARSCYDGPAATAGVGTCSEGQQLCINGQWDSCDGQQLPRPEGTSCNGADDDCNGLVDDGATVDCSCTEGSSRACYTGPAGTLRVGTCAPGMQLCSASTWGPCQGQTLPSDEASSCDGVDQDCDGHVDEGIEDFCGPCGTDCRTEPVDVNCGKLICFRLPKQEICRSPCDGFLSSPDAMSLTLESVPVGPPWGHGNPVVSVPHRKSVDEISAATGMVQDSWVLDAVAQELDQSSGQLVVLAGESAPYEALQLAAGAKVKHCAGAFDSMDGLVTADSGLLVVVPCNDSEPPGTPVPILARLDEFILTGGSAPELVDIDTRASAAVTPPPGRPFVAAPFAYFPGDPVVRVRPALEQGLSLHREELPFAASDLAVVGDVAWSIHGRDLQRTTLADGKTQPLPLPDDVVDPVHVLPVGPTQVWLVSGRINLKGWDGTQWLNGGYLYDAAGAVDTGLQKIASEEQGSFEVQLDTGSVAKRLSWQLDGDGFARAYVAGCGPVASGDLLTCAPPAGSTWNPKIVLTQVGPVAPVLHDVTVTVKR